MKKRKNNELRMLKSREVRDLNDALKLCSCHCHEESKEVILFEHFECCNCYIQEPIEIGHETKLSEQDVTRVVNNMIAANKYTLFENNLKALNTDTKE